MKTITIGRGADCNIVLSDAKISRKHALLKLYPMGKMEIVDFSVNGTFVNGIKISKNVPVPVSRKDTVTFAYAERLDWSLVPNSLGLIRMIAGAVIAIITIILVVMLGIKLLDNGPTIEEMPIGGGGSTPTETSTERRDTTKTDGKAKENDDKIGVKDFFKKETTSGDKGKKSTDKDKTKNTEKKSKEKSQSEDSESQETEGGYIGF